MTFSTDEHRYVGSNASVLHCKAMCSQHSQHSQHLMSAFTKSDAYVYVKSQPQVISFKCTYQKHCQKYIYQQLSSVPRMI